MNVSVHVKIMAITALLCVTAGQAVSQRLEDMRFDLLDEEDGLSNHWINRMALDSSGYLWISSTDGLNRFDGHQFKVFRRVEGDSSSLLDNSGQIPFVDREGRLWIGYSGGGLSLFDETCQCFKNYLPSEDKPEGLPFGTTYPILQDRRGAIWFSGRAMGLNAFHPGTGRVDHYDLPDIFPEYSESEQKSYNSVTAIYEDPDGLMWVCSANGLYTFHPETGHFSWKQYAQPDTRKARNDYFNCIIPDGTAGFWLSAWGGGVSYFDRRTEKFTTYRFNDLDLNTSIGNVVYQIEEKDEDELWVATGDRGLGIFHKKTGRFTFREMESTALPGSFPQTSAQILITPDRVMFVLTNDGLMKYNPNAHLFYFRRLPIAESQNSDQFRITRIIDDPESHSIYFATELGNGLNVLDTQTGELRACPVDISPSSVDAYMLVTDLLPDHKGRLWVMSFDYLYEYDKQARKLLKVQDPFSVKEYQVDPAFGTFYTGPDGKYWVLTRQGGLHRFDPDARKLSPIVNINQAHAPERVDHIAWDPHGRIWLAGLGGIRLYDPATNQFTDPFSENSPLLEGGWFRGMKADREGNIWVAVDKKGLLKIETKDPAAPEFRMITPENGLPNSRIFHLNIDPEGMIWMASIMGVVYMNPSDLSYRIFNQTVGMDKNTMYMRFMAGNNGAFYITTPGKYCRVDFRAVNRKAPLPKVYLDKFSISDREQYGVLASGARLIVRPGEDYFSFDFGCIDFTNQSLNKFAYMLEGWDKDWVQAGSRRYAGYTNLDGGQYVFRVKAANSEGVWSDPVSVPVFIQTPFYRKTWFAALAALVFAGLIYGLYLYRIRQIEETERLKTELAESRLEALRAQMNPHFIFNCLNSINRYIIKSDIKTASLYLTRFAKLIRLILDNSEHKKVVLSNEVEALRLYVEMESLRFDHKFTFDIAVEPGVDADNIEVPPLIIQPYVENAIWHGLLHKEEGGHLSVRLSRENGVLSCDITDNGIGREKAMEYKSKNAPTRRSLGMKLTRERLEFASDDFSATGSQKIIDLFDENGEACGTKVILTLPV